MKQESLVSDVTVFFQFISIHVRHKDFANWCGDYTLNECFANMTVIGRRVQEVKDDLRELRGINAEHVIMTSDEDDPAWWADVAAQGWLTVDHSRTEELYGRWWVPCCLTSYLLYQLTTFQNAIGILSL
jgi:hypothetical protein